METSPSLELSSLPDGSSIYIWGIEVRGTGDGDGDGDGGLYGRNPIHKHLLESNARLLSLACGAGELEIINLLLDHGADINHQDPNPLHSAYQSGQLEAIKLLVDRGADIEEERCYPRESIFRRGCEDGKLEIVRYCIEKGADTLSLDRDKLNAIELASRYGKPEVLELLLEKNIHRDKINKAIFHCLVKNYYRRGSEGEMIKCLDVLFKYGVDVNAKNSVGATPLRVAVLSADSAIVKHLLKNGADINELCKGQNILHVACSLTPSPEKSSIISDLINAGANVRGIDEKGNTPLHYACQAQCFPSTDTLIRLGAYVNAQNASGETPLHVACKGNNNFSVIDLLIERGAKVYEKTNDGNTPLHFAVGDSAVKIEHSRASNSMISTIKLLLNKGADPNDLNNAQKTPLNVLKKTLESCYYSKMKKQCKRAIEILKNS
jgi:ankyrin repeat protein